uniref:SWIM zinc finger family protein n=1 Tax=Desulfosarcina variabilis TaxID=2300 RepID=UPI003AFAEED2
MSYFQYPKYVSVAEKRARAEKKIRQLKKKNPNLSPVIIEGRTLAHTWWGKSWNANLERYADYSNRIGRGRSYVRHLAVLDLQIAGGKVDALVQGSRSKPYSVEIDIAALAPPIWNTIRSACAEQLDSLQDLLAGRFPKSLAHLFMQKGSGLFPSPDEIRFGCSCPDWAYMCKHVAAVLYGIGARLDQDPSLFFVLRQVDMDDLITTAVQETSRQWIEKAEETTTPTIAEADLGAVFGIDMDAVPDFNSAPSKGTKPAGKKKAKNAARPAKKQSRPTAKTTPADKKGQILSLIESSPKGIRAPEIAGTTGFLLASVRPVISRLMADGKIRRISRGVYGPPIRRRSKKQATMTDVILKMLTAYPKGASIAELVKKSGCEQKQVQNILFRLLKSDKIRRVGRGIYALK